MIEVSLNFRSFELSPHGRETLKHELQAFYGDEIIESEWAEVDCEGASDRKLCFSLYFSENDPLSIDMFLKRINTIDPRLLERVEIKHLAFDLWSQAWKDQFTELKTQRFLLCEPPKHNHTGQATSIDREFPIFLLPAATFGKGDHATTEAMLLLMERFSREWNQNTCILDIGSGNGILSIAAKKLGAGKVFATEMDEASCAIARSNFELNGADDVVLVCSEKIPLSSDVCPNVILSNILSGALSQLIPEMVASLRRDQKSQMYLSGFHELEAPLITTKMNDHGMYLVESQRVRGWVAALYETNPPRSE